MSNYKSQRVLSLFEDSFRKAEPETPDYPPQGNYGMRAVYSKKCHECGHGLNAHNAFTEDGRNICMDCPTTVNHTFVDANAPAGSPLHPDSKPNGPARSKSPKASAATWTAPTAPSKSENANERLDIAQNLRAKFHGTGGSKLGKSQR